MKTDTGYAQQDHSSVLINEVVATFPFKIMMGSQEPIFAVPLTTAEDIWVHG